MITAASVRHHVARERSQLRTRINALPLVLPPRKWTRFLAARHLCV